MLLVSPPRSRSRCSAAVLVAAVATLFCATAVVRGQEGPDGGPRASGNVEEALYVSPTSDGRWSAWILREGERIAVEVPQKRDEIVRFAEEKQYRINWYVEQRSPQTTPAQAAIRDAKPKTAAAVPEKKEVRDPGGSSAAPVEVSPKPTQSKAKDAAAKAAAATPAAPPTKAERVTRLQRQIESGKTELERLKADLAAPMSDYRRAEEVFKEVDTELQQKKEELESLVKAGKQAEADELKAATEQLEMRWTLTREWFDVAIQTRETVQAKIAAIEQKLKQDQQALEKLTAPDAPAEERSSGEKKDVTEPTAAAETQVPPETSGTVPGKAEEIAADEASASANPLAASLPAAALVGTVKGAASAPMKNEKRSRELEQAKTVADEMAKAAVEAEEEAASFSERLETLDKNIELQSQLLAAARKRRDLSNEARQLFEKEYRRKSLEGAPRAELQELADRLVRLEDRFSEVGDEVRQSAERLEELQSERAELQAQELAAIREASAKRKEAEVAADRVEELQNPYTLRNIAQWFIDHMPRLLAILVGMVLLRFSAQFFSRRIVKIMTRSGARGSREEREDRARTLIGVVHNATSLAIVVGGILMACDEVGIAVAPLMGGAAVVGLAVAFGAQNLIRDYFYGFVILLENQYKINDVVKIGETSGQVERITLRITVLRDLEGRVHFIPNGKIDSVTNMTHGWSRALFAIGVAYKEDADRVMEVLMDLARELRADPQFGPLILDEPEMLGLDSFGDSSINIKFILKTRPLRQWAIKRELLRRIKRRFDELGIEIPFPHRTVYHRQEGARAETGSIEPADEALGWSSRQSA